MVNLSDPEPDDGPGHLSHTPVTDRRTGVQAGVVVGLREFSEQWETDVQLPHAMSFEGWQMADSDHPAGEGHPAYRLVHKTLRLIPFPGVRVEAANMLLRVENGEVTVGEPVFTNALPARRAGDFLVPEWGVVSDGDGGMGFRYTESNAIHIQTPENTFPPGNYVEILCRLPSGTGSTYTDQLATGRAAVASLTAVLDLMYGPRLLGPVLAEEIGSVFDDWHWNRRLGGRTVAIEAQANQEHLNGQDLLDDVLPAMERLSVLGDSQRRAVQVASQWYWRAEREADQVIRFIGYWLVLEALLIGENSNINPVKDAVAELLSVDRQAVSEPVGRLYGLRNALLHGKEQSIAVDVVDRVRALAVLILESHSVGTVSAERIESVRVALDLDKRNVL